MTVRFDVAAPFNFSNYQYWIVFNTSGDGATPSTLPVQNNWDGYSDGIEVTGNGGTTSANAYRFIKDPSRPHAPPYFQLLFPTPQQLQYDADSNGEGTEFSVVFSRVIFSNPSMGAGVPVAPQYVSPALDSAQCFDRTFYALSSGLQIDPPAQILELNISNNPSVNPC